MAEHLIDGEFRSDKYPTTPRGKVPLSCRDPTAQDLLWEYAQRRRPVDAEFSADLEAALRNAGYQGGGAGKERQALEKVADTIDRLTAQQPTPFDSAGIRGAAQDAWEKQAPMREALLDRGGPIVTDAELKAYSRGIGKKDDAAYIVRILAAELLEARAILTRTDSQP